LCVARESKDGRREQKSPHKRAVREWITDCPVTGKWLKLNAEHSVLSTQYVATLRITSRNILQLGDGTLSYHFPYPISLCTNGTKPLTDLFETFNVLPTIVLKLS
jgi:hypothetical protein